MNDVVPAKASEASNLAVYPNVMPMPQSGDPGMNHIPGDLAYQIYGRWWTSPDSVRSALTERQLIEYEQHLICHLCKKPCAGTCPR